MSHPPSRALVRLGSLLALATGLILNGCDDERPAMPPRTDAWRPVDLPELALGSSLESVAFSGGGGYLLGISGGFAAGKASTDYLLLSRDPEGHWLRVQLADPPDNAVFLDLAAGVTGLAVGGYLLQDEDPCLVYDERGVAPAPITRSGFGIAAVDGDDALMLAGGTAIGGALWASRTPGQWSTETIPLDPLQEGGFTDVFVGGGRALACGFADGADTLQVVLELDGTGAWRKVPIGTDPFGTTLRCVAGAADGTLMVGGVADDGGPAPHAFLWRRDAAGAWSQVALPDAELIGGVNDVRLGPDGAWYLACGGDGGADLATVLRLADGTVTHDLTPFSGSLRQLASDGSGVFHAVGYRLTPGGAQKEPLLLKRD